MFCFPSSSSCWPRWFAFLLWKRLTEASIATKRCSLKWFILKAWLAVLLYSMKFSVYIKMIQCSPRIYPQSWTVSCNWSVGCSSCLATLHCNQKRFSQPNLYHRGNYHKVHRLLIFSCLLLLLVGWSNLCPSCKILRRNLGPAKASQPASSGKVVILCSIPSTARSPQHRRELDLSLYPTCWTHLHYGWSHSSVIAS